MSRLLSILLICTMLFSCAREKFVDMEGMKSYMADPDNGLRKQKKVGDFIVDISFVPDALRDTTREKTGTYQKVILKLKPDGTSERGILDYKVTSDRDYYIRLEYFNTYIQNDLYLVHDNENYPCAFTHFERYHGLTPHNTITAYFEMPEKYTEDVQIVYDDNILGMGISKYNFEINDIQQIPHLKYQMNHD